MKTEDLYRIEIIANQSVRDEILQELETVKCRYFTEIPSVYGKGRQEPKQGDGIWPEMNTLFIIYTSKNILDDLITSINIIKETFPHEGIKLFAVKAQTLL